MWSRRVNPALVVALLALGIAAGGTAVAASRYVITSPSQIKPSVLKSIAGTARNELHWVESKYALLTPGQPGAQATARCAPGDHIVTGGFGGAEMAPGAVIAADRPTVSTGWTMIVQPGASTTNSKFKVYALCETER